MVTFNIVHAYRIDIVINTDPHIKCCIDYGVPLECEDHCVRHPGDKSFPLWPNTTTIPNSKQCTQYFDVIMACTQGKYLIIISSFGIFLV